MPMYINRRREEFLFRSTPENIASFLESWSFVDQMTLTDPMDELITNTIGNFIDRCPGKVLWRSVPTVIKNYTLAN